jgi:hypothetical protein
MIVTGILIILFRMIGQSSIGIDENYGTQTLSKSSSSAHLIRILGGLR